MNENNQKNDAGWHGYYEATAGRPPRATLLRALNAFVAADALRGQAGGRLALDLGCGTGRDTLAMLAAGWHVVAVDQEPAALERLGAAVGSLPGPRLRLIEADLADFEPPPADLVNASFVLPFLPPAGFAALWPRLARALLPGGRLSGQLLGPGDSWVRGGRCWGADRAALDVLLTGYEVERLEAEEHDGVTPRGKAKHWQIWHLNLLKPPASQPVPTIGAAS